MSKSKLPTYETGNIGEHVVLVELNKRKYVASLCERGTKDIDIVATNQSFTKFAAIQVKTASDGRSFQLHKKHEMIKNIYFVLVNLNLNHNNIAEFYILHSEDVANHISKNHRNWLNGKKKDGSKRKDTAMRRIKDLDFLNKYKNRWDLLKLN